MTGLLTDAEFDMFRKVIYDKSGITFSTTNRSILDSRLKEKLREKSLGTIKEYYDLIMSDEAEMNIMLDSVTTNLTRFFRNQPHFDALIHMLFLMSSKKKRRLGITQSKSGVPDVQLVKSRTQSQ